MAKTVNWDKYKRAVNQFADQADQAELLWERSLGSIDRYMEDHSTERFEKITLEVLVQYNYFRSWPITKNTETGSLDNESILVYLNKDRLNTLGYLNAEGYFDFDPDADRFTIEGKRYKAQGDTSVSQAGDIPLHTIIILQREPSDT